MKTVEIANAPAFAEPSTEADAPHPVTLLSGIYLEAGLPLEAAAQAAIADYEILFEEEILCTP